MSDVLNIPSKNSYLTSKQWKEIVEYVKNRKNSPVVDDSEEVVEPSVESIHSEAYEQMVQTTSVSDMYMVLLSIMNESPDKLREMTTDEIQVLYDTATRMNEENPSEDYVDLADTLQYLAGEYDLNGAEILAIFNVKNASTGTEYSTLSSAVSAASDGNIIEVYNSFTETTSVKIQKQNLTIRAAAGYNPTISWTKTDAVAVTGASSYHGVVIYSNVTTTTTFGGSTGTLTFDVSKASDDDNKGERARVMMHCGSGTLNIKEGIVLTGGNPGGYLSGKQDPNAWYKSDAEPTCPPGKAEISGSFGYGAGVYMYSGTLNMSGGIITKNYSTRGLTSAHNLVGGGSGIYLHNGATLNLSGGTISYNEAGSGGGGGVLVATNATLNMTGGYIIYNATHFASGGGIGVQTGYKKISISGGEISNNIAEGMGGGLFARGDADPIIISGGLIDNNKAGAAGGGVLFWTVGGASNNKVIITGTAEISNNKASNGAGVSIGRESKGGQTVGDKCVLEITGGNIHDNVATEYGGGVYMQSDALSSNINSVTITSGVMQKNKASYGAGIYVPAGSVIMNGGSFIENSASVNGGALYISGGSLTMTSGTFNNNTSERSGGAVYVANGNVDIQSGTISNNIALNNGGAMAVTSGDVIIGTKECNNAGKSSSHIHPIIQGNTASNGGGIYVDGGTTTMWCGDIKHNHTFEKTVNVLVVDGNFTYNGGSIGIPFDTGVFVTGGVFDDNVSEAEGKIKYELYYHSVLGDTKHNGKIPESKWIASPRGDVLHKEDDDASPIWGDLFPEYEFVGWETHGDDSEEVVNLYAIWEKK